MELIVLGERHGAQALKDLGLINRVVALPDMLPTALALAARVASRSAVATGRLKRLLTSQLQTQLAGALELERQAAMACFADPDTAQRIADFANRAR
jgi:enoyl-CoA hydratase/carnithine racemase